MARNKARPKRARKDAALEHALAVAGGPTKLAQVLGITVQAVSGWAKCPPAQAIAVERATGGVVSRERLCPRVFIGEKSAA
ncbi:MAG TPA: Cro/CI family transcriptional regulator [Candidatus Binatia bacterium]|nr:Cro/CI family transcriptional regulator [Candidatus Binatia bacterium]